MNAAFQGNSESVTAKHRWRATETKIPRSFTEAMLTLQNDERYAVIEKEVNAMFSEGVLVPIDEEKAPDNAKKIRIDVENPSED